MQNVRHGGSSCIHVGSTERENTSILAERHVNTTHAAGGLSSSSSSPLLLWQQKQKQKQAFTSMNTSTSSVSSSTSFLAATDCSAVGFLLLRRSLDLLVRVQKTQSESMSLLTSLCNVLFPTHAGECNADPMGPSHSAVVAFDGVDREVLRLRILEVKHASLNPKLSESIENAMQPFQSYLPRDVDRAAVTVGACRESCEEPSAQLWESYSRVASLREQFVGLALLQEEAVQSLGAQLSELFPSTSTTLTRYYRPVLIEVDNGDEVNKSREKQQQQHPHRAVLRFLQQLEDVMASKQHLVLCLATSLRELYECHHPAAVSQMSVSSSLVIPSLLMHRGVVESFQPCMGEQEKEEREIAMNTRVSVSLSPLSTVRPSISPARDEALLPPPTAEHSPSPQFHHCQPPPADATRVTRARIGTTIHQDNPPSYLPAQTSCEGDVSPASGIQRSPSPLCGGSAGYVSASPPPPLTRCLQNHKEERCKRSLHEKESNVCELSESTPAVQPSFSAARERVCGDVPRYHKRRPDDESMVDAANENLRLLRLLEAKDSLILNMQERLFGAVPMLIGRIASIHSSSNTDNNSGNNHSFATNNSQGSCRSRLCSTHEDLAEEALPPPQQQEQQQEQQQQQQPTSLTGSSSTCGQGSVGASLEEAPHARKSDDSSTSELQMLRDKLAAYEEENHRLRATLNDMKEEKREWKQAVRELKEDNQTWRERERAARTRCEQLEDDVFCLKKRLLTSESALMLRSATSSPSALVTHSATPPLLRAASSRRRQCADDSKTEDKGNDGSSNSDVEVEGGISSMPTRIYSRTLPPSSLDDATELHTSASLQKKRNQLLAKIGRHVEEDTQPRPQARSSSYILFEDSPFVVVSPLTEERAPRDRTAIGGTSRVMQTATPPSATAAISSFSLSPTAVGIDRRLSPEYHSLPTGQVENNNNNNNKNNIAPGGAEVVSDQLTTGDVNRILASARSLLKSVRSSQSNNHSGEALLPASTVSTVSSSGSMWSDSASPDHSHNEPVQSGGNSSGDIDRYTVAATGEMVALQRRSISPCSSVSYSSAKKRAQRVSAGGNDTKRTNVKQSVALSSSPQQKQQQQLRNRKETSIPSPGLKYSSKKPPKTARDSLMRELRDQLHLLQTQHASVLSQEEQLQLKRMQVMAAIERQSNEGATDIDRNYNELASLFKRLDVIYEKVQRNEARLREHVEIVRQQ